MDYFGDYEEMNKVMKLRIAYIVVSLSDDGVKYLNKIYKEVTSRTTV